MSYAESKKKIGAIRQEYGCKGEIICNQKKYPYLANEVRWTTHFKWSNTQYQIANWTGVDLNWDEYRISNTMVNGYWWFWDYEEDKAMPD